jgi:hypothetical protein
MSSRFVKLACAAALATPLVAVPAAHAAHWTPEEDCVGGFTGAVTTHPHGPDSCYGIDQRPERDRRFPGSIRRNGNTTLLCPPGTVVTQVAVATAGGGTTTFPVAQVNGNLLTGPAGAPTGIQAAAGNNLLANPGSFILQRGDVIAINCAAAPAGGGGGGGTATPVTVGPRTVDAVNAQQLLCPAGTHLLFVSIDPLGPGTDGGVVNVPAGSLVAPFAVPAPDPTGANVVGIDNIIAGADIDGPGGAAALAATDTVSITCG